MLILVRLLGWFTVLFFSRSVLVRAGDWQWWQIAWVVLALTFVILEFSTYIEYEKRLADERAEKAKRDAEIRRQCELKHAAQEAIRADQEERERRRVLATAAQSLVELVTHHANELGTRRSELVQYGRYEIPDYTRWVAEKEFFSDEVLAQQAPEISDVFDRSRILTAIDEILDGAQLTVDDLDDGTRAQAAESEQLETSVEHSSGPVSRPQYEKPASQDESSSDQHQRNSRQLNLLVLVLGIVGAFLYLFAYAALIVGVIALRRDDRTRSARRWQAWAGTILGALFVLNSASRFASQIVGG